MTPKSHGCCAAPRAQKALRNLLLECTHGYAADHDGAALRCLAALLFADEASHLPEPAQAHAQLALRHGGLGLRSATRHAPAAYWADALRATARRDTDFAHEVAGSFASDRPLPLARQSECRPSPKRTHPLT